MIKINAGSLAQAFQFIIHLFLHWSKLLGTYKTPGTKGNGRKNKNKNEKQQQIPQNVQIIISSEHRYRNSHLNTIKLDLQHFKRIM